jgi:DnaB helicase-like protein/AAA domain-containing protein
MSRQSASAAQLAPTLPNNLEAERALLGAVLLDNASLNAVSDKIEPNAFFHEHHRKIYLAMLEMHEDGTAIDLITLCDYLQTKKDLENIGGAAYVSQLMDGTPHITNVPHYAKIVREKAVLRGLIRATDVIQKQALQGDDDVQTIIDRAEKSLNYVMELRAGETVPALRPRNGNGHVHFADYSLVEFMAAQFPPKEHLIQAITPRNGRAMLIALPHRLKSWFTTGLALAGTVPCTAFGHLKIEKPVRTYLAQLEDWPGELQSRIQSLILKEQFSGCNASNLRILPRCELDLTKDSHFEFLIGRLKEFKPDHVVLDVLRKFFSGDVNSPKETAAFLLRLDLLQTIVGCALTLVHHENRKKEELMLAAAGSYNWAGWAEVMIHFSRKTEAKTENGPITAVEIDVDTKAGPPVETMRLVLDTNLPHPLRMEALEDGTGFQEAMKQLSSEWTVENLASVLEVHRKSAWKRIVSWEKSGKIEKIKSGKRGKGGGLAVWRSLDPIDSL